MYKTILKYYTSKMWSLNMVRLAVKKGLISKSEFFLITNIEY